MTSGVEVPTYNLLNAITLLLTQRQKVHSANIEFFMNELSSD